MNQKEQIKEMVSELPDFIKENEDGTYTITLKKEKLIPEGKVIMEEKSGKVLESCQKMSDSINKPYEALLAVRSCVEPKLTNDDLENLKGSNYFKLKSAVLYIYGMSDFF